MIKPEVVSPGQEVTHVGRAFDAPLVVVGKTWLPLTQLVAWEAMRRWVARRSPTRPGWLNAASGFISMVALLGSEWCHNLAHAAAAKWVGHPADAIRIVWGMPLLVYHQINDRRVSPRQHVVRALGGPIFNLILLAAGLSPIPGLDGGPILKWSLVEGGATVEEADRTVRRVNWGYAAAAAGASAAAFRKRKRLVGVLAGCMAGIGLAIATGLLKETE